MLNQPFKHNLSYRNHLDYFKSKFIDHTKAVSQKVDLDQLLLAAARKGDSETIEQLISKGADIEAADNEEYTPLLIALSKGNEEAAITLIKLGADVNVINKHYTTPLHLAIQNSLFKAIEILIKENADVNTNDNEGYSPLYYAAIHDNKEVIELFLNCNIEINFKDTNTSNLLHRVIVKNNLKALSFLLNHGADPTIKNKYDNPALHYAIALNNIEAAKILLEHGAEVNLKKTNGTTPLHKAALNANSDAIKLLLEYGADINAVNNIGNTPLHKAMENDNLEIVRLLLEKGANINAINNNGLTPLLRALDQGNEEIALNLINLGADITITSNKGHTALHYAAMRNEIKAAELLIENGAKVSILNEHSYDPLREAVERGYSDFIDFLIKHNANPNVIYGDNTTALSIAIEKSHNIVLRKLIEAGANINHINEDWGTAIHFAAKQDNTEAIKILLEHGADVNTNDNDGCTPLHKAAYGNIETVKLLLENGADVNAKNISGHTVLYSTLGIYTNFENANLLLEYGADINTRDNYGDTPLHHAVTYSNVEAISWLIKNGADVNAKTNYDQTPLHHAARYGKVEAIKLLLEHDADIDAKDNDGNTPLHNAAMNAKFYAVELLLEYGARISARDNDGNTPLHHAAGAWRDNIETIKILIGHGADINAKDNDGNTPLHNAAKNGKFNAIKLLLKYGADINAVNKNGITPIQDALDMSWIDLDTIKLFLDHGAEISIKDNPKLLANAITRGNADIIDYFLPQLNDNTKTIIFFSAIEHSQKLISEKVLNSISDITNLKIPAHSIEKLLSFSEHYPDYEGKIEFIQFLVSKNLINQAALEVAFNKNLNMFISNGSYTDAKSLHDLLQVSNINIDSIESVVVSSILHSLDTSKENYKHQGIINLLDKIGTIPEILQGYVNKPTIYTVEQYDSIYQHLTSHLHNIAYYYTELVKRELLGGLEQKDGTSNVIEDLFNTNNRLVVIDRLKSLYPDNKLFNQINTEFDAFLFVYNKISEKLSDDYFIEINALNSIDLPKLEQDIYVFKGIYGGFSDHAIDDIFLYGHKKLGHEAYLLNHVVNLRWSPGTYYTYKFGGEYTSVSKRIAEGYTSTYNGIVLELVLQKGEPKLCGPHTYNEELIPNMAKGAHIKSIKRYANNKEEVINNPYFALNPNEIKVVSYQELSCVHDDNKFKSTEDFLSQHAESHVALLREAMYERFNASPNLSLTLGNCKAFEGWNDYLYICEL
jgi:ankyrin repeat protein